MLTSCFSRFFFCSQIWHSITQITCFTKSFLICTPIFYAFVMQERYLSHSLDVKWGTFNWLHLLAVVVLSSHWHISCITRRCKKLNVIHCIEGQWTFKIIVRNSFNRRTYISLWLLISMWSMTPRIHDIISTSRFSKSLWCRDLTVISIFEFKQILS